MNTHIEYDNKYVFKANIRAKAIRFYRTYELEGTGWDAL